MRRSGDDKKHNENDNALFGPSPPKRTKMFDPVDEENMVMIVTMRVNYESELSSDDDTQFKNWMDIYITYL